VKPSTDQTAELDCDILYGLYMARTTATTSNNPFPEGIDLVFKTVLGHPMNADCLAKHFRSILEVAGLPRIRLYDLRQHADFLIIRCVSKNMYARFLYWNRTRRL
jgi:hypothetical protein